MDAEYRRLAEALASISLEDVRTEVRQSMADPFDFPTDDEIVEAALRLARRRLAEVAEEADRVV